MTTKTLRNGAGCLCLMLCVSCSAASPQPLVIDERPVSTVLLSDIEVPDFAGTTNSDLYDYAMTLKEELRVCRAEKRTEKALVELKANGGRQGHTETDR